MPSAAVRDEGALQMRPAPCGYSSARPRRSEKPPLRRGGLWGCTNKRPGTMCRGVCLSAAAGTKKAGDQWSPLRVLYLARWKIEGLNPLSHGCAMTAPLDAIKGSLRADEYPQGAGRICNAPSSRTAALGIGPYRHERSAVGWRETKIVGEN